jgi:hypothetical protein
MDEVDNKPAQEAQGGLPLSTDDADVRVTIEQTRQALEASAAEIERSKRLLRDTEELGNQPVPPPPANSSDDGEPS